MNALGVDVGGVIIQPADDDEDTLVLRRSVPAYGAGARRPAPLARDQLTLVIQQRPVLDKLTKINRPAHGR